MEEEFILIPLSLWESTLNKHPQPKFPEKLSLQMSNKQNTPNQQTMNTLKGTHQSTPNQQTMNTLKGHQDDYIKSSFNGNTTEKKYKVEILQLIRSSSTVDISMNGTLVLDNVDTNISVETFISDLRKSKTTIPDVYLTVLSRLKLPARLVINEYALAKDRGDWITFRG